MIERPADASDLASEMTLSPADRYDRRKLPEL
jgi:hypothetical protein